MIVEQFAVCVHYSGQCDLPASTLASDASEHEDVVGGSDQIPKA